MCLVFQDRHQILPPYIVGGLVGIFDLNSSLVVGFFLFHPRPLMEFWNLVFTLAQEDPHQRIERDALLFVGKVDALGIFVQEVSIGLVFG